MSHQFDFQAEYLQDHGPADAPDDLRVSTGRVSQTGRIAQPRQNDVGVFTLRLSIGNSRPVISLLTKDEAVAQQRAPVALRLAAEGFSASEIRQLVQSQARSRLETLVEAKLRVLRQSNEPVIGNICEACRSFQLPEYATPLSPQQRRDFVYSLRELGGTAVVNILKLDPARAAELPPGIFDLVPIRFLTPDLVGDHRARLVQSAGSPAEADRKAETARKHHAQVAGVLRSEFCAHLERTLGITLSEDFADFVNTPLQSTRSLGFAPISLDTLERLCSLVVRLLEEDVVAAGELAAALAFGISLSRLLDDQGIAFDAARSNLVLGTVSFAAHPGTFALIARAATLAKNRGVLRRASSRIVNTLRCLFPASAHWASKPLVVVRNIGRHRLLTMPGGYETLGYRQSDVVRALCRVGAAWALKYHRLEEAPAWAPGSEAVVTAMGQQIAARLNTPTSLDT